MNILLDMDGVLTDWCESTRLLLGMSEDEVDYSEEDAKFGDLGMKAVWTEIDKAGFEFWSNMSPTEYKDDIIKLANKWGELFICTSPSRDPMSAAGKMAWLKKEFGRHFRNIVITPKKHLLSRDGTVLIDDRDSQIKTFNQGLGLGILMPQTWNEARDEIDDRVGYVRRTLEAECA